MGGPDEGVDGWTGRGRVMPIDAVNFLAWFPAAAGCKHDNGRAAVVWCAERGWLDRAGEGVEPMVHVVD